MDVKYKRWLLSEDTNERWNKLYNEYRKIHGNASANELLDKMLTLAENDPEFFEKH